MRSWTHFSQGLSNGCAIDGRAHLATYLTNRPDPETPLTDFEESIAPRRSNGGETFSLMEAFWSTYARVRLDRVEDDVDPEPPIDETLN